MTGVTAIYSPRMAAIVIIRADGEHLAIPEAEALAVADAIRDAFTAPAVAAQILNPVESAAAAR